MRFGTLRKRQLICSVSTVNHFLKIKQESSGFPDWVKTHEDKVKYVNDYYEHEGIHLRIDKIKYNPGLRAFAKLCLNS